MQKWLQGQNSDRVICGVLEDDFRLEEESSKKESDSILVSARNRL